MSGYTRQSIADIIPTAVVRAAPINAELNALRDAFDFDSAGSTGHKHDGSSDEGSYVPLIADLDGLNKVVIDTVNNRVQFFVEVSSAATEQLRIQDGVIVPVTDNDIDLGTSGVEFKDLYLDGTAKIDTLTVDENATIAGTLGVTSATTLSSTLTVTGTATFNGNTVIGSDATDTVTLNADVASTILPSADDTYDLGAVGAEWKDLYIDGTANIDSLIADTADINGGTIDGATIGGNSAAAITGTTITANSSFVGNLTGNVTSSGTSSFAAVTTSGNVTIGGTLNMTGAITGNLTGNVTGNLTGNVTATTGTSSFATVDFDDITDGTITITGFVDEDNMASDSATLLPTQQSVKAYVDAVAAGASNISGLTATSAELNVLDGDTVPASVTLVGTDGFPVNDAGVTKLALISDINTYVQGSITSLTNVTLTTPTVSGLYLSDSGFVVEGSSADANETTVTFTNPSADRTITFPDATGTVLLSGDIGSSVQAYDAGLADLAGLAVTDGNFIVGNGTNWVAESGNTAILSLGITATSTELNVLDGITASTSELNILDGVTASTAELNILDGVTASAAELNVLDGITASTTELNYVDGVTSAIQTQLDAKATTGKAIAMALVFG